MSDLLHVSQHPLVLHKLALLRSSFTEPKKFRELVHELSQLLFYEATEDLALAPLTVQTPLAPCQGYEVSEQVGIIPILRAGLGMAEAIIDLLPTVHVWHLGLYRDHETLQPVTYYNKLPNEPDIDLSLILDPMLATGGSAIAAVDILKAWGARRIKFVGLLAAPEGVAALHYAHPDVDIHLAAVDSHLNEQGYIVPGLGDAGDRQFGTG
ncbi:uracil phosphoribosyltransferase [Candidatus Viridilinea mediisalina]|uniref:Uracil phosphoribosyltransferase n=1 Tax=Candidatus Viridilinea mediisalina TaxID=2024553 RepID=A0A2A6RNE2_9CHLR|nr:uracil phosphoribosyltransferase [Candidatus Viridilinea mediisalina]PDW04614.1 uracil phosphoribosyltransferase [Candidatus Viridilinea mediisalina]